MSFVATLHLDRIAVIRMIVAGSAWGLTLSPLGFCHGAFAVWRALP